MKPIRTLLALLAITALVSGCASTGGDAAFWTHYNSTHPVAYPETVSPPSWQHFTSREPRNEVPMVPMFSPPQAVYFPPLYTPPPTFGSQPLIKNSAPAGSLNVNRYDPNSLANPYGAGSPYKADGLMNPYSQYGSEYSNKSWRNPYATDAPKLYDSQGNYHGKLSTNPYDPDSTSNPYGKYGSQYSPDSINNPYGAGSPYRSTPIYVVPSK